MQEHLRNETGLLRRIGELETEKENLLWIIGGMIGLALLACVVVGSYWYYQRRHPEPNAPSKSPPL